MLEQRKILHVAGANLDHVGVFLDQVERFVVNGFGNNLHSILIADVGHDAQSLFAQTLKGIGRSPRLVRATSKKLRARAMHSLGYGKSLVATLNAARPG